jgi:hypothetical protein
MPEPLPPTPRSHRGPRSPLVELSENTYASDSAPPSPSPTPPASPAPKTPALAVAIETPGGEPVDLQLQWFDFQRSVLGPGDTTEAIAWRALAEGIYELHRSAAAASHQRYQDVVESVRQVCTAAGLNVEPVMWMVGGKRHLELSRPLRCEPHNRRLRRASTSLQRCGAAMSRQRYQDVLD